MQVSWGYGDFMADQAERLKKQVVRFGVFELDLDNSELRKQGVRIQLQPKPLEMLKTLIERPREIVTREELRSRMWGDETFVDYESGLNTAANRLRLRLSDSAENPRYIETVARIGYRFIAPIERVDWDRQAGQVNGQFVISAAARASAEERRFSRWRMLAFAAATLLGLTIVALTLVLRFSLSPAGGSSIKFRQLTFRRGQVLGARFTPDGQSVLYSAQWDREPRQVYLTAAGSSPESRLLGFTGMTLTAVSNAGELALLSATGTMNIGGGKLMRVPMHGSAPSYVDRGIMTADWAHDPAKMAIVRAINGQTQLEYPAGRILFRTAGWISNVRFAPVTEAIAFIEHATRHDEAGRLRLLGPDGNVKTLGGDWVSVSGLAWHPSGKEIWFTASRDEGPRSLWAVAAGSGRLRSVLHAPGVLTLRDIARDGRLLISRETRRLEMAGKLSGDDAERGYSWLDWSRVQEVSPDGGLILFDEDGEAAGPHSVAYIRRAGVPGATRLGIGLAMALSAGGQAALLSSEDHKNLRLVPIDGGQIQNLPDTGLFYQWVRYFPDGKRLLALASQASHGLRLYVQTLGSATATPISQEMMVRNAALSPDGNQIAVLSADGKLRLLPVAGGEPVVIPSEEPLAPLRWSRDGRWIFVQRLGSYTDLPAHVLKIQVATGRLKPWRDLMPLDSMGVNLVTGVSITADETGYVYSYRRVSSELYLGQVEQ